MSRLARQVMGGYCAEGNTFDKWCFSRLPCVAIRVTYIDGHTADYDDRTHWYVEHGVLKLGSLKGRWDTYISPSSWETIDTNPL